MRKQFLVLVFLIAGIFNLSAFAKEKTEKVIGKMTLQNIDCTHHNDGGTSCSGSNKYTIPFIIHLKSANNDSNNIGSFQKKLKLKSGATLFTSVFVNHINLTENSPYYIISTYVYGYDAYGQALFEGGMVGSSTEVYSLEDLKNTSTETPLFLYGDKSQKVVVLTSDLHSKM
jgi:hypothetical protein